MTRGEESGISPEEVAKEIETIIDIKIEELIMASTFFNEGNNGLIFKINIQDVSEEAKQILQQKGIELKSEHAIKILKVYTPGAGKREFELQKRAYEIINGANDPNLALIPKPILFRDIKLNEETITFLANRGMKRSNDRAEVILMDFIPGEDLATILYKETLRRNRKSIFSGNPGQLDDLSFGEIHEEAARVLDYHEPKKGGRDEAAKEFRRERVYAENAKRLINYLNKAGFVLNPNILKQVKNTIDLLHSHNFYFRDGHHRNFMVVGDYDMSKPATTEPKVYLIDFGGSIILETKPKDEELAYTNGIRRFIDDYAVVRELEILTSSADAAKEAEQKEYLKDLKALGKRVIENKEYKKSYVAIAESKDEDKRLEITKNLLRIALHSGDMLKVRYALGFINELLENNVISKELLRVLLGAAKEEANLRDRKLLQDFLDNIF